MSRTRVVFDGYELTRRFVVSDLRNPLVPRAISSVNVPGMDGSTFTGALLAPREVKMTITVMGATPEELEAESRALAAVLAKDGPAPLHIGGSNGLYYMVVANASSEGARSRHAISYDVTFTAHEPVAYGARQVVTVPSGGSASFNVDGTYWTMPTVVAPAASNGSNGYWRLTLDDGDYFSVEIPNGASPASIEGDCAKRVLKVNGSTTMLDALATWLEISPGSHTIAMHGTGAATVEFVERWL